VRATPIVLYLLAAVVLLGLAFLGWTLFHLMLESRRQDKAAPTDEPSRLRR
jgi:hypothetical protein